MGCFQLLLSSFLLRSIDWFAYWCKSLPWSFLFISDTNLNRDRFTTGPNGALVAMSNGVIRLETRVKPHERDPARHSCILACQLTHRDDLAKLGKVRLYICARKVLGQARHVQICIFDQLGAGTSVWDFDLLVLDASSIHLFDRTCGIILMAKLIGQLVRNSLLRTNSPWQSQSPVRRDSRDSCTVLHVQCRPLWQTTHAIAQFSFPWWIC